MRISVYEFWGGHNYGPNRTEGFTQEEGEKVAKVLPSLLHPGLGVPCGLSAPGLCSLEGEVGGGGRDLPVGGARAAANYQTWALRAFTAACASSEYPARGELFPSNIFLTGVVSYSRSGPQSLLESWAPRREPKVHLWNNHVDFQDVNLIFIDRMYQKPQSLLL